MRATDDIGSVLLALEETIRARRNDNAQKSYTASLLKSGVERCAKKFGEEAVEAALAAMSNRDGELVSEAADVLYHLLVLLASRDVSLEDVATELTARARQSGHEEKASRARGEPASAKTDIPPKLR